MKKKFEVGKWYKIRDYYGKLTSEINSINNIFPSTEYIDSCKKYISNGNYFSFANIKELNTFIEVPLSEIQQYLPDGHVDKVTKTNEFMFKKGDYIVTLDVPDGHNCARNNYCFKQRVDQYGIYPCKDLQGLNSNGHDVMSFDKKQWLKNWRYATKYEIAEYDRLGKPYDVTTLIKEEEEFKVGDWITILDDYDESIPNFHIGAKTFKIGYISFSKQSRQNFVCEEPKDIGNGVFFGAFRKALPHEIPTQETKSNDMTKEELLEEAKRRYPKGTKFNSAYDSSKSRVSDGNINFYNNSDDDITASGYSVYYKGNWAEIVSEPKEQAKSSELTSLPEKSSIKGIEYLTVDELVEKYPLTDHQVNIIVNSIKSVKINTNNEVNSIKLINKNKLVTI